MRQNSDAGNCESVRYIRQELVIGKKSQERLRKASISIVGIGALGSLAAELLTRSGVGSIALFDRDIVELSNLQRQVLYVESDCGHPKADAALRHLRQINSEIKITAHVSDINFKNVGILDGSDLILDCSDNLYTRFLINEYSRKNEVPWIYAGAIREQGNVMAITPSDACFRCIFEEAEGIDTCDNSGIMNTASAIIASIQVQAALHILLGIQKEQSLVHVQIDKPSISLIRTKKNPDCPACRGNYEFLLGKKEPRLIKYECSGLYTLFSDNMDFDGLAVKLGKLGKVRQMEGCLFYDGLSIFRTGKIIIRTESEKDARAKISRFIGM